MFDVNLAWTKHITCFDRLKATFLINECIISNDTIYESKIFQYLDQASEKHLKDKHRPDFNHIKFKISFCF